MIGGEVDNTLRADCMTLPASDTVTGERPDNTRPMGPHSAPRLANSLAQMNSVLAGASISARFLGKIPSRLGESDMFAPLTGSNEAVQEGVTGSPR